MRLRIRLVAYLVVIAAAVVTTRCRPDTPAPGKHSEVKAHMEPTDASNTNQAMPPLTDGSNTNQTMPRLTDSEKHIILEKGTERPFTGKYWNHFESGVYVCRQCGTPLYTSKNKFRSDCGWPSFDDEIPGAVKRQPLDFARGGEQVEPPDADGSRTEITCAACGAHLGHVFEGEGLTPGNVRHCVNSTSLVFRPAEEPAAETPAAETPATETPATETPATETPAAETPATETPAAETPAAETPAAETPAAEEAIFAGGCFWGVEHYFQQVDGVKSVTSGYTGGHVPNPTYEQVCTGTTGHAESVRVVYDPARVSYEQLARLFFEIHDPTELNRQGPDAGTQYRSAVFFRNDEQKKSAEQLIALLRTKGYDVVTQVLPAGPFYPAEEYHQDYIDKHPERPCHARVPRFDAPSK